LQVGVGAQAAVEAPAQSTQALANDALNELRLEATAHRRRPHPHARGPGAEATVARAEALPGADAFEVEVAVCVTDERLFWALPDVSDVGEDGVDAPALTRAAGKKEAIGARGVGHEGAEFAVVAG